MAFTRPGRIPLFSNVNEFNNVVKFNIAGVVKINNVWRRTCGPINCFDDKSNLTLLKIYQKSRYNKPIFCGQGAEIKRGIYLQQGLAKYLGHSWPIRR